MIGWVSSIYKFIAKKAFKKVGLGFLNRPSYDEKLIVEKEALKRKLKHKDKAIQAQDEVINAVDRKDHNADNLSMAVKRMRGKKL